MPRQPQLRKKKVREQLYWYTDAGGSATYFGKVDEVPFAEANRLFAEHVTSISDNPVPNKRAGLTAGEMMDLFVDWVKTYRSERSYETRKRHCSRFGAFSDGGKRIEDLPADKMRSTDLEAWLAHLADAGHSAQTRKHAMTSIKAAWNWATKNPSPTPYLPPAYRPFAAVPPIYVDPKMLTEADLITDAEIKALFAASALDLDNFHRFGPTTPRPADQNPYRDFGDMLRCYYATGARTSELSQCRVADVQPHTSQVVLGKHKRSKTQRTTTLRYITLNAETLAIFDRYCRGKEPDARVFANSDGRPFSRKALAERFNRVKEVAAERGLGVVRREITIYSFRDLWISEALMAPKNKIETVAHMAGTSVEMIRKVYGHFRNDHLLDTQANLDAERAKRGR
jgi:integrase